MKGNQNKLYLVIFVFCTFLLSTVCSAQSSKAACVRIITGTSEVTLTYEQLFATEETQNAYSKRDLIPIANFLDARSLQEFSSALAYYGDGSQGQISLAGFLEWRGNTDDYLGSDGKSRKKDIIGIWLNAPELSIAHIVPEALSALEQGRVLVILLDGLSYYDLQALEPAFLSAKQVLPARTVMPPISPVALATILTGELPNKTGVQSRSDREVKVDDIFVTIGKKGKTAAIIEGSTKLINTSLEQILNPDLNGNGSTDDEVFASAKAQLEAGLDFVFVHFHGYDDLAHTYGPLSPESSLKLLELDTYVEQLCADFFGTILVMADHGQHSTEGNKLGDHGEFQVLDMTIPWVKWVQP